MADAAIRHLEPVVPTSREVELARESSRLISAITGRGESARIKIIDGEREIDLPVKALQLLESILSEMAAGHAVQIVPYHAELTTQEAADFLNVSRPFLVKELSRGQLAYRMVGTHRRILFKDLLEYRARMSRQRGEALQSLADLAQQHNMGY